MPSSTPLCLAALEMRTGRVVHQWRDEFGHFPPYRLDADALSISYMLSAEYGCTSPPVGASRLVRSIPMSNFATT